MVRLHPIHREQWQGIGDMMKFYLFMRFDPGRRTGHNPLAAFSYAIIYSLIMVEILTGLALFDQLLHNPVRHQFIGWLPRLIELPYLRLIHFFLMYVFFAFIIFHIYASVLVSAEEENGLPDSIFSGWKFMPAGALRREIAKIPEARRFAKRYQLLPPTCLGVAHNQSQFVGLSSGPGNASSSFLGAGSLWCSWSAGLGNGGTTEQSQAFMRLAVTKCPAS
jgi:Prokaryotic cytochrome b561